MFFICSAAAAIICLVRSSLPPPTFDSCKPLLLLLLLLLLLPLLLLGRYDDEKYDVDKQVGEKAEIDDGITKSATRTGMVTRNNRFMVGWLVDT